MSLLPLLNPSKINLLLLLLLSLKYWENLANDSDKNNNVILYIIALLLLFSAFATPWLIAFFFEFKVSYVVVHYSVVVT